MLKFHTRMTTENVTTLAETQIVEYILNKFDLLKKEPTASKLVAFHTSNKFLLMAHNQEKLHTLGNIVANHKKIPFSEVMKNYEVILKEVMDRPPTVKRHINTLMHIFSYFSTNFDEIQKKTFLNLLDQYRESVVSLGEVLWMIEPLVYQYNKTYLIGQTYFLLYAQKRGWALQ